MRSTFALPRTSYPTYPATATASPTAAAKERPLAFTWAQTLTILFAMFLEALLVVSTLFVPKPRRR